MKIWTTQKVLAFAVEDFKKRGIASPRLEAEVLLSHVLRCPRLQLYTEFDRPLVEEELNLYRNAITRRRQGEPSAYIIGKKEFWSLDFQVNPSVLIPRPETEILVEQALARIEGEARVLDLCTGTGCIAIAIAQERPNVYIDAVDISAEACRIAEQNAAHHGVMGRITILQGDLFQPLSRSEKYHVITANPPYVRDDEFDNLSQEVQREPRIALFAGPDGLDVVRAIINEAPAYLRPGGTLLMEVDPRQIPEIIENIGKPALGEHSRCEIIQDLSGKERILAWRIDNG